MEGEIAREDFIATCRRESFKSHIVPFCLKSRWSFSFTHTHARARTHTHTPGKELRHTHWIGGWVDPRASLDASEKRKIFPDGTCRTRIPQLCSPKRCRYTDWTGLPFTTVRYLHENMRDTSAIWRQCREDVWKLDFGFSLWWYLLTPCSLVEMYAMLQQLFTSIIVVVHRPWRRHHVPLKRLYSLYMCTRLHGVTSKKTARKLFGDRLPVTFVLFFSHETCKIRFCTHN
jgi:hypothetical protein